MCLAWRELRTNKLCQHSVCSPKISLSHLNSFLCRYRALPLQHCHLAHFLLSHLLDPPLSPFSFIYILSLQSSLNALSLPPFPPPRQSYSAQAQAGRQAGRLPGWGPRWCSGESASSGSLSLQDGRTALLWPIWPRPVLAPVCDYGPAGGRQGWLRENRASTQQTGRQTVEGRTNTQAVI